MRISKGFEDRERPLVAAMYCQAFGPKLGRVLGPDDRARRYIAAALMPDHALCARDGAGHILGVAGFKSYHGALVHGGMGDLWQCYGTLGCLWRGLALTLLQSETDNRRFLVDGLFVAREARGQGIGTRLLEALAGEAAARGYTEIRLDVIAENARAQALYARRGFHVVERNQRGMIPRLFGIEGAITMVRKLGD